MKSCSSGIPPSKYVFYPLYKFYRRNLRLNMYASNFATWTTSAAIHAAIFLPEKEYTLASIFGGIFLGLGALSTGIKIVQHQISKKSSSLDDIVE